MLTRTAFEILSKESINLYLALIWLKKIGLSWLCPKDFREIPAIAVKQDLLQSVLEWLEKDPGTSMTIYRMSAVIGQLEIIGRLTARHTIEDLKFS